MKQILICFVFSCFVSPLYARYPLLRVAKHKGEKQITIINESNETIYLRLKPFYIQSPCSTCATETDACCAQATKKIEFRIAPHAHYSLTLTTQKVGLPEDEAFLDYTHLIYGKIHQFKKNTHSYITLIPDATYVINVVQQHIKVSRTTRP